jgi:hypothetical protein
MRKRSTIHKGKGISHQSLRSACCHEHSENATRPSGLMAYAISTKEEPPYLTHPALLYRRKSIALHAGNR